MNKSRNYFFILFFSLFSCEFSVILHKDIFLAQKYLDERKFANAAAVFEDLLKKTIRIDTRVKVLYQLGEIYYLYLNRPHDAIRAYQQILGVGDVSWQVQALERMGEIEFQYIKNYSAAEKHYKVLSEFNPKLKNFDFYQLQVARSMAELGNHEMAIKIFKQLNQDQTSNYRGEALYHQGKLHFRNGQWNEAVSTWQEYLKSDQQTKEQVLEVKFFMANCFEMTNQLKDAYALYYGLLDTYPNVELIKSRLKSVYARRVARKR